jgi:methionyl aminopeptidase
MFGRRIESKSDDQLRRMRQSGLVVARTLELLRGRCRAGVATAELDRFAEHAIRDQGGLPSFPEVPGYRHTLCVSVNEEVVHGVPGARVLRDGDLVSIDCGATVDGWHGDAAISLIVGGRERAAAEDLALMDATEDALWAGIGALRVGRPLRDVGAAVEDAVRAATAGPGSREYGIVEGYEGHGIGRQMHMPPGVANHRVRRRGPTVPSGATLAIEPMITLGSAQTRELADGWTVVTVDGAWAAHWEHTVAVTHRGLWVLTALDGGQERLAAAGLSHGPLP